MKKSLKSTLLIGNGLNRCLENSISWSDLLKDVSTDYDVEYNGAIPMPLEFESIVNQILKKSKNPSNKLYEEIKEKIAQKVIHTKLPENSIHYRIKDISINSVLTTNYDNLLEYVFDYEYKFKGGNRKKYLFSPVSIQKGISFYHIHGHAENPKSICLGYEHYMGIVEHLRKEINTKENGSEEKMKIYMALKESKLLDDNWYEKFYTDNIYIVGLGLSESEVDLWWLLTHRAYLFYSDFHGIKENLVNKIIYYDIVDESKKDECVQKDKIHYMLSKLNVNVKKYILNKDCKNYLDGYNKIFDEIYEENNHVKTDLR